MATPPNETSGTMSSPNSNYTTTSSSSSTSNSVNINSSNSSLSKKKTKGRTFQCVGYPDCNMTFTRSEHLARHIRKHTGERPFECTHCSRKFSRLDNLRQHKQTVHAHERVVMSYVDGNSGQTTDQSQTHQHKLQDHQHQSQSYHQNENQHQHQHHHDHRNQQQQQQHPQHQHQHQHSPQVLIIPANPHKEGISESSPLPSGSSDSTITGSNQSVQYHDAKPPAASTTLLRPTQFRSKHRPRPLALPTRKSVYTDAPYTVPTPRSATSTHLALSPTSPSHNQPPLSASILTHNKSNNLPSFQFLTSANQGESLISPYNSSFNTSSIYSANNTPINSSFDLKTPTSSTFEFSRNSANKSGGSIHSPYLGSFEHNRKSWNNSFLNNVDGNKSDLPHLNGIGSYVQRSSPKHQYLVSNNESRKLKIESLLNNSPDKNPSDRTSDYNQNIHQNDLHDRVRLPPVENLGIQRS